MEDQIIKLGKLIVKQLDAEEDYDITSKWMSYYLAGKMNLSTTLKGKLKAELEKECSELILNLWKHRHYYVTNKSPFARYEPIFKLLESLLYNENPFFITHRQSDILALLSESNLDDLEIQNWLDLAKEIDFIARLWIEYIINKIAKIDPDPNIEEWLDNSYEDGDSYDSNIMKLILGRGPVIDMSEIDEKEVRNKMKRERIENNIDRLKKFSIVNDAIIKELESDLNNT